MIALWQVPTCVYILLIGLHFLFAKVINVLENTEKSACCLPLIVRWVWSRQEGSIVAMTVIYKSL